MSDDVKVINAPERIYLQTGDFMLLDEDVDFNDLTDVTWCADSIEKTDIAYVRADALEVLQRENDALKHDIARHVAIASEEATRADGLRAALQEAIDLRTILYCNGCDECEEGICSGNPVKNDPYAKKWSAALQSGRKP